MIKLIDILKETTKTPVTKEKVIGLVNAKRRQEELIKKGYELGKDFIVVQDRTNKKIYIITPK
jgi:predicted transcriptional regulator